MARGGALWAAAAALALTLSQGARAADNDEAARALVQRAFKQDPKAAGQAAKSKAMLELARKICEKDCSPPVQAEILIGFGTLHAYGGRLDEARSSFAEALKLDPKVKLLAGHAEGAPADAFEAAKKPAPAPPAVAAPPGEPGHAGGPAAADTRRTVPECEGASAKPPSDWQSYKAFCYFSEAVSAEAGQEWVACADYASRSLDAEDRTTTRYLGAQCNERAGRWVTALREYNAVVARAQSEGKKATAVEAQTRSRLLSERMPRLVIRPPGDVEALEVTVDGKPVAADQLGGEMFVDPGPHAIEAKGTVAGSPLRFKREIRSRDGTTEVVELSQPIFQDPRFERCYRTSSTPDELKACIDQLERGIELTFTVKSEVSGYLDSDAVEVLTPSLVAQVEDPTAGWGLGAGFLVDVVTAASADIVATASPRWTEVRYVPSLNGHVRFGDLDLGLSGMLSHEPDYLALGAGIQAALDLLDKNVTPALRYDFGYDTQGRAGTPFDVFSETIHRHAFTGSLTLVLDKTSILVPAFTSVIEIGDTSKPYRFLPTFEPGTEVLLGETVASVNQKRTSVRLADQLPDSRQRYALAALYAKRFSSITLRAEERLYLDSWGLKASTTDVLLPWDISDSFRLWPHVRFHGQSGVDFWQRAYFREVRPDGGLVIPLLRTGDRELGPMVSGSAGLGSRFAFGDAYGLVLKADVIYTRFLDHLYVLGRLGGFGGATFEMLFQ